MVLAGGVRDDFDGPVIFVITDSHISVTRHFVVCLCDRSLNSVGVQIPAGLCMDKTDDVTMANIAEIWGLRIIIGLIASRGEEPVVVGVLMVVAGDLLLSRALGICLDVRVKKPTTVSHVFDGGTGANYNFERGFFDIGTFEVGLEERAHLGVTRAGILEDKEVEPEAGHVDCHWNCHEADDAGNPVLYISNLFDLEVSKLVPEIFNRVESNQRGNKQTNPFHAVSLDQQLSPCQ